MDFQGNDGKGNDVSAKKQLQDWATDLIKNLPDGEWGRILGSGATTGPAVPASGEGGGQHPRGAAKSV